MIKIIVILVAIVGSAWAGYEYCDSQWVARYNKEQMELAAEYREIEKEWRDIAATRTSSGEAERRDNAKIIADMRADFNRKLASVQQLDAAGGRTGTSGESGVGKDEARSIVVSRAEWESVGNNLRHLGDIVLSMGERGADNAIAHNTSIDIDEIWR